MKEPKYKPIVDKLTITELFDTDQFESEEEYIKRWELNRVN